MDGGKSGVSDPIFAGYTIDDMILAQTHDWKWLLRENFTTNSWRKLRGQFQLDQ